ncbi:S26 family signal peptidase [Mobilitalea sibirica]|uniref:S26 family signal peptidase n=2 Tax=Mobilitalea sibirica TaxID=1462919 RepID=A0A8J7HBM0_9FIRM|nr:S24 family peptidase [Mobilitalea sibirica]MBH1939379.1 S26 family signal peptidase [Mobilitalea sibirica]
MCQIKNIEFKTLYPFVKEIIDFGKHIRITVTGMSMYPFLRSNKDSVVLKATEYSNIRKGDIVLVQMDSKQYILHRIVRRKKHFFYMCGDAQTVSEGPIRKDQIIAKVIHVWREGRCISCSNLYWRILSFNWILLFPFRRFIIMTYCRVIRKIYHRILGGSLS